MKPVFAILIFLFTFPAWSNEFPKNVFVAYDESRNLKLTADLPVSLNESAEVSISQMNESGPETILMEARVANVPVDIDRTNRHDFPSLSLPMGRSGAIELVRNHDGSCTVRSTLREFYYPQSTRFEICSYFYAVGTRPGLTGSN